MLNRAGKTMFSIGEFSTISGITVRTLRFYHELGLLVPATIDPATNYRTYDERNLETAKVIAALRGLEFPLEQIREDPGRVPRRPRCPRAVGTTTEDADR